MSEQLSDYERILSNADRTKFYKAFLFKLTNTENFSYFEDKILDLEIIEPFARECFIFIREFRYINGAHPSLDELYVNLPGKFDFIDGEDISYENINNDQILQYLHISYKKQKLLQIIENFTLNVEYEDTTKVLNEFESNILKLKETANKQTEDPLDFYTNSEDVLNPDSFAEGFSYGIPSIDNATGGIKPGEYIIVFARPKSNKSYFARFMTLNLIKQNVDVFYCSFEFNRMQEGKTFLALYSKINPAFVQQKGKLSAAEMNLLKNNTERLKENHKGQIFNILDSRNFGQLTPRTIFRALEKKIKRPDRTVIILDQVSQMSDDERSQTPNAVYTNISKAITNFCSVKQIPVVAIYQANRDASERVVPNERDIQWSDRPLQDCHVALALGATDEMKKDGQRYVKTVANRLGEPVCSLIKLNIAQGIFEEIQGNIDDPDEKTKNAKSEKEKAIGEIRAI